MLIIPAIDIKNGKCVRLIQGDFENEKVYSDNPVQIAKEFENDGVKMLHVIDLDGAKAGKPTNFDIIKNIAKSVSIPIQVGGGIRTLDAIKTVLDAGISRIILGTIALDNENLLQNILSEYSSQIIVALDTKKGELMKKGWFENSDKGSITTALKLENAGVKRFIYTDVIRDGTLTEPNYNEIANLMKNVSVPLIASGGISNVSNIKHLKSIGVEGVIIGKALYEGKIDLKEALNVG